MTSLCSNSFHMCTNVVLELARRKFVDFVLAQTGVPRHGTYYLQCTCKTIEAENSNTLSMYIYQYKVFIALRRLF